MNAAYIHLALNNFPPFVNLVAVLLLMGGMLARSTAVVRAAFAIFLLAAVVAVPVYLSGERAEDVVKGIEGVNTIAIHPHEEAGEWALIMLSIEGVGALAALLFFRRSLPRWAAPVMLILALLATAAVFRTAALGGRIHHPESGVR
jgi:hypothetical protein